MPAGVAHRLRHGQDRNGRPRFRSMRYPQQRKARAVIGSGRLGAFWHRVVMVAITVDRADRAVPSARVAALAVAFVVWPTVLVGCRQER